MYWSGHAGSNPSAHIHSNSTGDGAQSSNCREAGRAVPRSNAGAASPDGSVRVFDRHTFKSRDQVKVPCLTYVNEQAIRELFERDHFFWLDLQDPDEVVMEVKALLELADQLVTAFRSFGHVPKVALEQRPRGPCHTNAGAAMCTRMDAFTAARARLHHEPRYGNLQP